jgi:hypothetical protein
MRTILLAGLLLFVATEASAQYFVYQRQARSAYYGNYYNNHGVYYGGPASRSPCGYYGCSGYLPRGERRIPTYRHYDFSWGGGDRGYLGGRGGGWGGEW